MKDKRIVFMGTPLFAVPILEGLIENYNVVGVVSQPDKCVGRKRELVYTPIKEVACLHNIKVLQPETIKTDYQEILDLKPDMIVTCAYGQIIPKELLDYPEYGCINVHASLLPKLRGGAPIQRAIINGLDETGITIMYMDTKMDNGDIIEMSKTKITMDDDLESLHDRLSLMGRDLLLETLPKIFLKQNKRIKQNENEVHFAYNIKREDEHIDFNKSAKEVYNKIRGLSPNPSAYVLLDGNEMKVYRSIMTDKKFTVVPGTITNVYKNGIGVMTGTYEVILTEIKPFGKKRMLASSYVNGLHESLVGKVME